MGFGIGYPGLLQALQSGLYQPTGEDIDETGRPRQRLLGPVAQPVTSNAIGDAPPPSSAQLASLQPAGEQPPTPPSAVLRPIGGETPDAAPAPAPAPPPSPRTLQPFPVSMEAPSPSPALAPVSSGAPTPAPPMRPEFDRPSSMHRNIWRRTLGALGAAGLGFLETGSIGPAIIAGIQGGRESSTVNDENKPYALGRFGEMMGRERHAIEAKRQADVEQANQEAEQRRADLEHTRIETALGQAKLNEPPDQPDAPKLHAVVNGKLVFSDGSVRDPLDAEGNPANLKEPPKVGAPSIIKYSTTDGREVYLKYNAETGGYDPATMSATGEPIVGARPPQQAPAPTARTSDQIDEDLANDPKIGNPEDPVPILDPRRNNGKGYTTEQFGKFDDQAQAAYKASAEYKNEPKAWGDLDEATQARYFEKVVPEGNAPKLKDTAFWKTAQRKARAAEAARVSAAKQARGQTPKATAPAPSREPQLPAGFVVPDIATPEERRRLAKLFADYQSGAITMTSVRAVEQSIKADWTRRMHAK